jgi:MFS family permease
MLKEVVQSNRSRIGLLRALRSRNYRLFFVGQSISLIGTWMTRLATSWLIYRLTHSAFLLGLSTFVGQAPLFLLPPFVGVWLDRWNRHRTLVVTQVLAMVQSLAMGILAITGKITITQIVWLMLFQGFINAFDMPARQAFVVEMVDHREDLPNAIALNSSMVNLARLIGPAIAGALIGSVGEAGCFLIDGVSYAAVIVSLLLMHVPAHVVKTTQKRVLDDLAEGWRYVTGSIPIRSLLLLLALASLVGMPYSVLMPLFAANILHGGPHTLGLLMGATGIGAFLGAITLAGRKTVLGLGRLIPVASGSFGLALVAFAFSKDLRLSLALLLIAGFGMMSHMAATNTILQTILDENKRGRVMAFYAMAFAGTTPFGGLLAGFAAARWGAPATVAASGVVCLIGTALYVRTYPAIRSAVRPIYTRLGILPKREVTIPETTT